MAAGQVTQRRRLTSKSFTGFDDTQSIELKGLLPLRRVLIDVQAQIDPNGSAGSNGTARYDDPHSICGEIVLVENGGPNLHKVPGDLLADFMQALWKQRPAGDALGTTVTANSTVTAGYELPFSVPRSFADFPDDTAYLAEGKSLVLSVRLGGARTAGSASGGFYHSDKGAAPSFDSASYAVEVEEVVGMGAGLVRGKAIPMLTYYREVGVSTQSRLQRILDVGQSYRLLLAKMLAAVESGATSFGPSATVLNSWTLETGLGTNVSSTARQWRNTTKEYLRDSTAAGRTGLYVHDFAGLPEQTSNTFDASRVGSMSAYYDITKATNQTDVVTGVLSLKPVGANGNG